MVVAVIAGQLGPGNDPTDGRAVGRRIVIDQPAARRPWCTGGCCRIESDPAIVCSSGIPSAVAGPEVDRFECQYLTCRQMGSRPITFL